VGYEVEAAAESCSVEHLEALEWQAGHGCSADGIDLG
jgi:hypothetical protein